MDDNEIIFITTTINTKWKKLSGDLIKQFFPLSTHIHIDGSKNWPMVWFSWIEVLKNRNEKYFCHIDEDCFLLNGNELKKCIEKLDNENATLMGIPDAFFYWRGMNEVAINPFFLLGNREKMLSCLHPNWTKTQFEDKYFDMVTYPYDVKIKRVSRPYEPFYCLFWSVLKANEKLYYLKAEDDFRFANNEHKLPATTVKLYPNNTAIVLHMWYTREWHHQKNLIRYEKAEEFINKNILH